MSNQITTEILSTVWSRTQPDIRLGWVFLPMKTSTGQWVERHATEHRNARSTLDEIVYAENYAGSDVYFTPLVFEKAARQLGCTYFDKGVLFADLDYPHEDYHGPEPSVLWETSPGSSQAVWFLSHRVGGTEWASLNKGMTYAAGADRGGWHENKVLRIPRTLNYKRTGPDDFVPLGKLVHYDPNRTLTPADAERYISSSSKRLVAYPRPPANAFEDDGEWEPMPELRPVAEAELRKLSGRQLYRLTNTNRAVMDRSREVWMMALNLKDTGFSVEDTFLLIRQAPWNKFRGRDVVLWDTVYEAHFGRYLFDGPL